MYGGRSTDAVLSGIHELQHGHLGRRILHGDAVGTEKSVISPLEGIARLEQMGEKDLLSKGKRPGKCSLRHLYPGSIRFVMGPDHIHVVNHSLWGGVCQIVLPGYASRAAASTFMALRSSGTSRTYAIRTWLAPTPGVL